MSYASVFMNGGSQAVRIPAAYRFDTDRVSVEAVPGGILLRPIHRKATWKKFFERCDACRDEFKDFELERPANVVPQSREMF